MSKKEYFFNIKKKKEYFINKFYIGETVYFVSPDTRATIVTGIIKEIALIDSFINKELTFLYRIKIKGCSSYINVIEENISLSKEDIKRIFFKYQEEQRIIDRQDLEIKED